MPFTTIGLASWVFSSQPTSATQKYGATRGFAP